MILNEVKQDLFTVSGDHYLIHCISSDFVMGAGIATQFAARGVKAYLKQTYKQEWTGRGYSLFAPMAGFEGVYNLVTKKNYWQKPTLQTMEEALTDMCLKLPSNAKVAMPYIGCGLDKLNWDDVRSLIMSIFNNTDIEITICGI